MANTSDSKAGWTAAAGVGVVALTAAVISFTHVRHLALDAGETQLASWLLPISIDGAIVAAVAVILADSRAGRRPASLTWLLLALGLAGSLAANIASAEPTLTARAVAAWPPVGLALGIEVLAGLVRRQQQAPEPASAGASASARASAHYQNGHASGSLVLPGTNGFQRNGTPVADRQDPAVPRRHLADADAVSVIRQLDAAAPTGRASRLAIQRRLGCGGSKAARLAELARQPTSSPAT